MAQNKIVTVAVIVNNNPKVTVTKEVPTIVNNGVLVPNPAKLNPGVNTRTA